MIIYTPKNTEILRERLIEIEQILNQVNAKHCFITGSFLYKKDYKDIDLFILTRSKKSITFKDKRIKATIIDFNIMHSLFFHSITKFCVSKNILPKKNLKVTISDYWGVINEAVPTILNQKRSFSKEIRSLVLYTEYFNNGLILDSFELHNKTNSFGNYKDVFEYISKFIPYAIEKNSNLSYIRRYFYGLASFYRKNSEYDAQRYLFWLCRSIVSVKNGRSNFIQEKSLGNLFAKF